VARRAHVIDLTGGAASVWERMNKKARQGVLRGERAALTIECEVDGRLLQSASTSEMAFPIPTLIAELSRGMTLRAGDLLLTGTPSGIGNARDPQVFLADGNIIETRVSGLGTLRNRVTETTL